MTWNPSRLPDQHGRVFVVTGGNAGLGYFTVEQLAATGARVILASRDERKADAAIASVRSRVPDADLGFVQLDLASLASARSVGEHLGGLERLDGLVLNAGMTTGAAERTTTEDGHELTFGVNYLGHFALAAGAIGALERTSGSRIVGLGSLATLIVRLDPDDLQSTGRFDFFRAYGFSKHAIHGLIFELDRRFRAAGGDTRAVLAHPGYSVDGLTATRAALPAPRHPRLDRMIAFGAQGKNRGAAPTVRALLDPTVSGGDFVGPRAMVKGPPVLVRPAPSSASAEFGRTLWRLSEEWTGVELTVGSAGAWPSTGHRD